MGLCRLVAMLGLFAVALSLAGCGDGRTERVPVSGQVLIDGEPLTIGSIRLIPDNDRPATGVIGQDGRFTLTTYEDQDGVIIGTHKVTVAAREILGPNSQRWYAPKTYLVPTGLTATIDGPQDDLKINLTWAGGKPFIERTGDGGE